MGYQDKITGPDKFHQPDVIQRDIAKEHEKKAAEYQREKLHDEMRKREAPSEAEILGPSEPKK